MVCFGFSIMVVFWAFMVCLGLYTSFGFFGVYGNFGFHGMFGGYMVNFWFSLVERRERGRVQPFRQRSFIHRERQRENVTTRIVLCRFRDSYFFISSSKV